MLARSGMNFLGNSRYREIVWDRDFSIWLAAEYCVGALNKLIHVPSGSWVLPGAFRGRGWLVHRGPIGSGGGLQTRLVATRSKHLFVDG